jgi:hypothetical protein
LAEQIRIEEAFKQKVHFRYLEDCYLWPEEEVKRFLKNRVLSLVINWKSEIDLPGIGGKLIYEYNQAVGGQK